MSKQVYPSSTHRTSGGGSLGRAEHVGEDERPFAEIRKNLNDALRILALHRWVFFIPFCLVTGGTFVASLYAPRTYQATSTFERRNDPVMMNLPMSAGAASFKYFRNTMVRDLTSVETMGEVVEELGLMKDLERNEDGTLTEDSRRRRDALARALGGTLSITTNSLSELIDIIRITYTGSDPTIGKKLVDQAKKTYIRHTMSWIYNFLTRQRDYFAQEAAESLEEVKQAKREETHMRLQNPFLDPTDPGAISMKLGQLELERRELLLRTREYEAELSGQTQMLAAIEPETVPIVGWANRSDALAERTVQSPQSLRLLGELAKIDGEIQDLRESRGMTDSHPDIQDRLKARRRIEAKFAYQGQSGPATEDSWGNEPAEIPPRSISTAPSYQGERARLVVQIGAQRVKIKDIAISLQANGEALAAVRKAKDEIYEKQEAFADLIGRVAKATQRLSQLEGTLASIDPAIKAIDQNRLLSFSQGQPARGGATPVSPKANTIVVLALLAGTAAGVVFVLLAELFDHVYRSSNQVSRTLGLPILESIDEIVTGADRRRILLRRAVVTPLVLAFCLGLTGFSGAMAYLSIKQPWTYERIRGIPQAAIDLFVDSPDGRID